MPDGFETAHEPPPKRKPRTRTNATDGPTAAPFIPKGRAGIETLARALPECRGCELYRNGTTPVFGEGSWQARIVLVGEQPGDQEETHGHPFVGPAGRLLDEALAEAGIARRDVYVTNVVKHFRFTLRGKRRMHKRPSVEHVRSCLPWLEAELARVRPALIVALGATAAAALLGRGFRLTQHRGEVRADPRWAAHVMATTHPSAVVRQRGKPGFDAAYSELVADLRRARASVPA